MKATSFAPGHISGFFEPVYNQDLSRTGSRGAGINISLGAISEVKVENSSEQNFEVFINNKKSNAPVTKLALKYLLGDNPLHIVVKNTLTLPVKQGFGMSASSALSATYAVAKLTNISKDEAMKASHFAEVQLKTGLGDVMASWFGGIEIRKSAGLPPWGIIEHIPGNYDLVLCVIGKKMDTKKVLNDPIKSNKIINYGKLCTKKLIEKPSVENFFSLSKTFAEKTGLLDSSVQKAMNAANKYGMASMCMLGNSLFAVGKTNELKNVLSNFGKVYICSVDEFGPRFLQD